MSVKKEVLAGLIACDISKVNCPNCIYSRPFCGDANNFVVAWKEKPEPYKG